MHKPRFGTVALAMLMIVLLTGCAEMSGNPKTAIGGLGGATVGGLIAGAAGGGSAGIAAGGLGGGLLGGLFGHLLGERDPPPAAPAKHPAPETMPRGGAT